MKLVKRGSVYYLRLRRYGKEEWISTQKGNEREAKKIAERIVAVFNREKHSRALASSLCEYAKALARQEIERQELSSALAMLEKQAMLEAMDVIDSIFPLPVLTADDLFAKYNEKDHSDIKPKTLRQICQKFQTFIAWAGQRDMRILTPDHCLKFLKGLKVADQTWNNYISAVSTVFAASPEVDNPWRSTGLRKTRIEHKERAVFQTDNLTKLLNFCDAHPAETAYNISAERWAAFIRVLYYTGLRPIDVIFLERREITESGAIELMPEKTGRTRRKVSYKADPKLLKLLHDLPADSTGRWFADFDPMLEGQSVSAGFRRLCEIAQMPPMDETLYGLRHKFATFQLDAGNDDVTVAAAIGHISTDTTNRHYYHGRRNVELTELPEV